MKKTTRSVELRDDIQYLTTREVRDLLKIGATKAIPPGLCRDLIAAAERDTNPMMRPYILTAMFAGLRPGEMLALRWSDIDFTARTLTVSAAITQKHGKTVLSAPKTQAGYRTSPLRRKWRRC